MLICGQIIIPLNIGKVFPLRPGVAQRVGRGIALLFHDRGIGRGGVVSSTHVKGRKEEREKERKETERKRDRKEEGKRKKERKEREREKGRRKEKKREKGR